MPGKVNIDEETTLIGMWLQGDHLEDISKVDYSQFHYSRIVSLIKQGFDAFDISRKTGISLSELMRMTSYTSTVFYDQAFRKMVSRKLEKELREFRPTGKGISELKELILSIGSLSVEVHADKDVADKYIQNYKDRRNVERVLWSGLPSLNRLTNGIKRKQLTTIAGRPATGKSAFALQVALGIAESGKKVLFFPLEMSNDEMIDRILIHKGLMTPEEAYSGQMPADKLEYITNYLCEIEHNGNFKFYEGVRTIEQIEEAIRREKPFAVVLDQLTQMRSSEVKFKDIREQFSYMTSNLKALSMRHNVAAILLCQLNRDAQERKPTVANLKESGSIEEDSDNIILLHRLFEENIRHPETIDWRSTRPMILILAKQRSGDIGEVKVLFNPSKMLFYEEYVGAV